MTQSIYSYKGTEIHLILDDVLAQKFNNAMRVWTETADAYMVKHNKPIRDLSVVYENMRDDEKDALDKVTNLVNLLAKINGGKIDYGAKGLPSAYLIRLRQPS
jgi:hypothetical protein